MLKKLTRALFGKPGKSRLPAATDTETASLPAALQALDLPDSVRILTRDEHGISRKQISPNALKVLYRLGDAGFHAFLVGGGVRDLLLKGSPKDFDISTDATPEEVRELFRNSRIIGRRFKIVHIRFGREIIEVTTFRAHHQADTTISDNSSRKTMRDMDSAHSDAGMILRDNVYGSIGEDALRRDFTINALYYTTRGFVVLDFADGQNDLDQRMIRIIGDPETRYREDPVRLLRAIRFAAKLDFRIEPSTEEPIDHLADLLGSVSPARLFDETLKLLAGGNAERTYALITRYRIMDYLFPATRAATPDPDSSAARLVQLALRNTDRRLQQSKSITPAFLYAALLWPPLLEALKERGIGPDERPRQPVLQEAANEVVTAQLQYTAIPRRFTAMMREIWDLQWRLMPTTPRRTRGAFEHPRFRAAYDFLVLREEAGEQTHGQGQWWTEFQRADEERQNQLLADLQSNREGGKKRRRRSRPKRNKGNPDGGSE
ncbi:MAG: polynucleotide adenylyltransferase PcnB [Pseudohongiellaceae bacterium]